MPDYPEWDAEDAVDHSGGDNDGAEVADSSQRASEQVFIRLLRQVQAGVPYARDDLVEMLKRSVVGFARTIAREYGASRELAEDAAAAALEDIYYGVGSLQQPERLMSWVRTVTYRRARRMAAQEMREYAHLRALEEEWSEPSHPTDEIGARAFTTEAVVASILELPPRQQSVLVLRLFCGFSEQEAANVLMIAVGTVKSHYATGRASMAATLSAEGFRPSVRPVRRGGSG